MLTRRSFMLGSTLALSLDFGALAQTASAKYQGKLVLSPKAEGRLMQLQQAFGYVDASGVSWEVPSGAIVDGASIPRILWPIIGGPWDGPYIEASVVHDWFCAVRIMPWQKTHRMFYEAMLTSGISNAKAKLMFLAVRYAGPSWDDLTLENSRILSDNGRIRLDPPLQKNSTNGFATEHQAEETKRSLMETFAKLSKQVEQDNLSISQIENLVDKSGRAEDAAAMLE